VFGNPQFPPHFGRAPPDAKIIYASAQNAGSRGAEFGGFYQIGPVFGFGEISSGHSGCVGLGGGAGAGAVSTSTSKSGGGFGCYTATADSMNPFPF